MILCNLNENNSLLMLMLIMIVKRGRRRRRILPDTSWNTIFSYPNDRIERAHLIFLVSSQFCVNIFLVCFLVPLPLFLPLLLSSSFCSLTIVSLSSFSLLLFPFSVSPPSLRLLSLSHLSCQNLTNVEG